jgi:NAD(P)-dependent dehydrogenase (short-subunit alcohol dehydrogenase family)
MTATTDRHVANPTYDFTGQVAFVTGASSGMGLATARAFAESGAAVTLADVNDDALASAERTLREAGHQVLAVHCDVADEAQVGAGVTRTVIRRLHQAIDHRPPAGAMGAAGLVVRGRSAFTFWGASSSASCSIAR